MASECGTSYYSEYDPFDYLYSCGTQYSDPVYEAVNKIDRTPMSPPSTNNDAYDINQCDQLPDWDEKNPWDDDLSDFVTIDDSTAPPLPPRNSARRDSAVSSIQPPIDRTNKIDRLKVATKLDENIIVNKTYDAELVAFYNMVSVGKREFFNKLKFFNFFKLNLSKN